VHGRVRMPRGCSTIQTVLPAARGAVPDFVAGYAVSGRKRGCRRWMEWIITAARAFFLELTNPAQGRAGWQAVHDRRMEKKAIAAWALWTEKPVVLMTAAAGYSVPRRFAHGAGINLPRNRCGQGAPATWGRDDRCVSARPWGGAPLARPGRRGKRGGGVDSARRIDRARRIAGNTILHRLALWACALTVGCSSPTWPPSSFSILFAPRSRYLITLHFAALALHENPECRGVHFWADADYLDLFIQETAPLLSVSRLFLGRAGRAEGFHVARAWSVQEEPACSCSISTATDHDSRALARPRKKFRPERFEAWSDSGYALIPQGRRLRVLAQPLSRRGWCDGRRIARGRSIIGRN